MNTSISPTDHDYAAALADAAASAEHALDEARIPLHILLTAQFGELNDNQEEMIGAAATALERVADELRALRTIADAGRDPAMVRRDLVRIGDIVRALQPELTDQALQFGVTLSVKIEPALPSIRGASTQLRDAIRLALTDEIRYAIPGSTVVVQVQSTPDAIVVTSRCGTSRSVSGNLLLAERLLSSQGAHLEHDDRGTMIAVPRS